MAKGHPLESSDLVETMAVLRKNNGNFLKTAIALGVTERQLRRRIRRATDEEVEKEITHLPIGTSRDAPKWEITSLKDNTYRFGAFGDLHAASKYCRAAALPRCSIVGKIFLPILTLAKTT